MAKKPAADIEKKWREEDRSLSRTGRKTLRDQHAVTRYNLKESETWFADEFQSRKVPPDTDRDDDYNNTARASSAQHGLIAFAEVTGQNLNNPEDGADTVADLVCNLAHYCDRKGLQLSAILQRSVNHYHEETKGKGLQFVVNTTGLQSALQFAKGASEGIEAWFQDDSNLDALDAAGGAINSVVEQLEEEVNARAYYTPPAQVLCTAFDKSDLATVLAALRLFQRQYSGWDAKAIRREWPKDFVDSKGEKIPPLGTDDIASLCERLRQTPPTPLCQALQRLISAAEGVVANWESGDLAGAVNNLSGEVEEAKKLL